MMNKDFHTELKGLINTFCHHVYDVTDKFPKAELFGLTSQLRRAALSVMLNYVEGYARQRKAVLKNFLEISYGSLKESRCIIQFSYERNYITKEAYEELTKLADRIGAMLWGTISKIQ